MRRATLAFSGFLLVCLAPSRAQGQSDGAARAQTLFDQAMTAMDANDYPTACPRFAASQKLDPKTSTLLNLARCYELNGQTASAWATFMEAEVAARKYGRNDWADRAAAATKKLEPKLVRLTVHVPQAVRAPRLSIMLDGTALQSSEWDQAIPIDPGQHRLEWSAPDFKPKARSIDVTTTSVEVTLVGLERIPRPIVTSVVPSFWTTGRVVGVVLGGIGITSVAGGSVLGLAAGSKYDEAEQLCGASTGSPRVCAFDRFDEANSAREDTKSLAMASTVLFVAGGVLAASGAALFAISSPRKQQRFAVVPWPNGVGAVGSW